MTKWIAGVAGAAVFVVAVAFNVSAQNQMSFFVTSVGPGTAPISVDWLEPTNTARRWQRRSVRALAPGAPTSVRPRPRGSRRSTQRDGFGKGPWMNVKGEVIAKDVTDPAFRHEQPQEGHGADRERRPRSTASVTSRISTTS